MLLPAVPRKLSDLWLRVKPCCGMRRCLRTNNPVLCASLSLTCPVLDVVCSLPSFQDFERSRAFTFLNEIKKRFQTTYGSRAQTALPYAMNSEFSSVLAAQLVRPAARWDFPHKPNFTPKSSCFPTQLEHHAGPGIKRVHVVSN